MKLRTQILLFLLLFGLTPVIAMLLLNMPMAFQQMERFYHDAHLLNLRADFRDLDEQLASRNETVRLLAKLPDSGILNVDAESADDETIITARQQLLTWMNRILNDQFDVSDIYYIDTLGRPLWQLRRNRQTGEWEENTGSYPAIDSGLIYAGLGLDPGRSMYGPLNVESSGNNNSGMPGLNMRLISPIHEFDYLPPVGMVVINLDIGGLASAHSNTLWVFNNGEYLSSNNSGEATSNAFEQFPGLEEIFAGRQLALFDNSKKEQIIWVPMFPTSSGDPLWVGRRVDPSPLAEFTKAFFIRVILLVIGMIVLVWLLASSFAQGIVQFKDQLTRSIRDTLDGTPSAAVPLQGPGELHELAENLNQLAEVHATNNRALQKHTAELEASNRYKSEFLANVSHELRTPLNSILLLSKMLRDDDSHSLKHEHKEQAGIIHRAGNDLKTLIDNILDLSRIEANRCKLDLEDVAIGPLLQDIHEMLEPQFSEKKLQLKLEIPEQPLPMLQSEGSKIAQVIKNFLSNALKFTEAGTVATRVEYYQPGSSGHPLGAVRIEVKDPGIGIPPEHQHHIFEAFHQADGSTNRRFSGTGLGLSISNELSKILGGYIEVTSAVGEGSSFSLWLPLRAHDSKPADEIPQSLIPAPVTSIEPNTDDIDQTETWEGTRVLLITASVPLMLELTRKFEKLEIEVSTALDVAEALDHLDEEPVELLVVDFTARNELSTLSEEAHDKLPAVIELLEPDETPTGKAVLTRPIAEDELQALLKSLLRKESI